MISEYKKSKAEMLKKLVSDIEKTGLSSRRISAVLRSEGIIRSHTWVAKVLKELSNNKLSPQ